MMDWLDALLSRMTMYRLVTWCLGVLLGLAGVLSLVGYLAFPFISLIASVVIFLTVTYGSGRLFGWLFGVRPHGESSIITALILTCLFLPPVTVMDGVKLALVAVFATASKYLFAIRGRHIFNPAATAAVIASVTGVAFAGWWVATPALMPLTLVIAFLILFKTRRLEMAGTFVAVAFVLVTAQTVLGGSTLNFALWSTLTSWPILFFAGVMLSEPLTQPPRRWQQQTIAALVAVLIVIPLHIATLSMTPALALIIGNAIAFWWGARHALKLKFVTKKQITPTTYEFEFAADVPFIAGQYLEFTLPHKHADNRGIRRVFTIATNPGEKKVRFGIKFYDHPSTFKQALLKLKPGTIVQATRVAGDFLLPADTHQAIAFIAGGVGITPLISFIRSHAAHDITLVYAVATPAEVAYQDELVASGIKVIIVTRGGMSKLPKGWQAIDAPYVSPEVLGQAVPDIKERIVYTSGSPLMVNASKRAARKLGAVRVMTDHFTGY
jgi:glycine betaine catabolism B